MKKKLYEKRIVISCGILLLVVVFTLIRMTLKDSYAYYGGSNELPIIEATIGKLKPTIDKVYIEEENKQYTNKTNPSVTIEWPDDNITEYCVTTGSTCDVFIQLSDLNNKSVTATNQITLSGDGLKTVNAYIKNKYGYTSAASSDTITLDTTAPTISSVASTEITETTITVSVSGDDTNGISQYCYGTIQNDYTCIDSNTYTFSNLGAGKEYTFWFYLVDNAGNNSVTSQYTFTTISKSAKDVIVATSKSLESEGAMQARNAQISGPKDDLRRFVGTYQTVTDNFICFGTSDQNQCKQNMDTYMYRIIGIDTSGRLKLIKATKIVSDKSGIFEWCSWYSADIKWNASDLYKVLNNTDGKKYFIGNIKYSYMSDSTWTNLISPVTYYIGKATDSTNPNLFINERKDNFSSESISLMYLSDYLYANDGTANTDNWLFIQNGLNRDNTNLGNGATAPTAEDEWTMTRYGYYSDGDNYAWTVYDNGPVDYDYVNNSYAVRPVFYIDSSRINLKGTGIITDPYYITNVN